MNRAAIGFTDSILPAVNRTNDIGDSISELRRYELALFLGQALYQDIAVKAGNHHMPRPCCDSAADDQMVTVEDACPSHAVTANGHHVGVRCLQIQQRIERELVFHVVQRRAGKAGWNVCVEAG